MIDRICRKDRIKVIYKTYFSNELFWLLVKLYTEISWINSKSVGGMASTTFILSLLLLLLLALFSALFSPPEVEPPPALELLPGFSGLFPEFDCCCCCCELLLYLGSSNSKEGFFRWYRSSVMPVISVSSWNIIKFDYAQKNVILLKV